MKEEEIDKGPMVKGQHKLYEAQIVKGVLLDYTSLLIRKPSIHHSIIFIVYIDSSI
jgi:hypothetical protein